ncbi:MAG: GNAT family N-acetyltransferase [Alphaproteobacteria bacterium]|nr:GNAT family N-acetyltransferase [Alphaproteobacteria bacterium]
MCQGRGRVSDGKLGAAALIRFAIPADYDQWRVLWDGYNAFYGRSGATALADDITRITWARVFDPGESMHCLVAEREGRLIGLAHYLFHRSMIAIQPVCYLQDLFTAPESRGEGIGRTLIARVYDEARLAQASRVYWHTHETNTAAQGFYDKMAEKSGFIVYRKQL